MNIKAELGENLYTFTQRVIKQAFLSNSEVMATHNGVTIRIYSDSCEYDVLDKFNMQRTINNLRGNVEFK